jgi:putative heme-binding domain-containing protein
VTSTDLWFRPVDMTVGPDGAVYIADWYDDNISHSSPTNRSQWYEPSRLDGRVWRVAPPGVPAVRANSFDLGTKSSSELIALLSHPNDWYARAARRLLAERRDASVLPELSQLAIVTSDQRLALQALWSIYVSDGLNDPLAEELLESPHEYVRAWTVRLLGDSRSIAPPLLKKLVRLAREDTSVVVRSQLACTAKRLPAHDAMAIVAQLVQHHTDADDVHIPLLVWWAIEDKAISDMQEVLRLVEPSEAWRLPLIERTIIERLARRFTAEGSSAGFSSCATLLRLAPTEGAMDRVVAGMLQALSGRKLEEVPADLEEVLVRPLTVSPKPDRIELALRMNRARAIDDAIQIVTSRDASASDRIALIGALGETRALSSAEELLSLLGEDEPLQLAALSALGYFHEDGIAEGMLKHFPQMTAASKALAIDVLCSRSNWAIKLVEQVDSLALQPGEVSFAQLQRLRGLPGERLATLVTKHWGRIHAATPLEKQGRITAVQQMLARGDGDTTAGAQQFATLCANCHKLHGQGNSVGPDLTGADRKNLGHLVQNVVDPSGVMRQEFLAHVAQTNDGRILTGLVVESTPETITLLDAQYKRTTIRRSELESLEESAVSIMPENLLDGLTEQQVRDLFAYLASEDLTP